MKKNNMNLRDMLDAAKEIIGNKTFRVGSRTVNASSALMYLLCLLCAVFIWANVTDRNTEIISRSFDGVAITLEGETALAKNELAVYEIFDKTVSVTVEGSKHKVNALKDGQIVASVKASSITESGIVRLDVSIKGIGKLDAVVSPSSVRVFVDESAVKDVSVNVSPTYEKNSAHQLSFSSNIETVTVSGAKSIVEKIAQANVSPALGYLATSITASAPISLVDKDGNAVDSSYITTSVSTVVIKAELFTEKTVALDYALKYQYPVMQKNFKVTFSPSEITLKGDPDLLAGIDKYILTEIDVTKISGDTEMFVGSKLPAGLSDVDQNSGFNVSIELLKCEKASIKIPLSDISFKNGDAEDAGLGGDHLVIEYIVDSASKGRVSKDSFTVEIDCAAADMNNRVMPTVSVNASGFTLFPINIAKVQLGTVGD